MAKIIYKYIIISFAIIATILIGVFLWDNSISERNRKYYDGIELIGTITKNQDYGPFTICYLDVNYTNNKYYQVDEDLFVIEICDSIARIIYKRSKVVFKKTYQKQIFLENSTLHFNINNDGWIREFRNDTEVYKRKCWPIKRPQDLDDFCQ